jgi:carboxypeptidase Taq
VFADYDQRLEAEGTGFILEWLREHVYAYGQVYATGELVHKATGEDLNPGYFLQYANTKFAAIYGLSA